MGRDNNRKVPPGGLSGRNGKTPKQEGWEQEFLQVGCPFSLEPILQMV